MLLAGHLIAEVLLTAVGEHEFAEGVDGSGFEGELAHGFLEELVGFVGREFPEGSGSGADCLRAEARGEHAFAFVEMGFFVGHG